MSNEVTTNERRSKFGSGIAGEKEDAWRFEDLTYETTIRHDRLSFHFQTTFFGMLKEMKKTARRLNNARPKTQGLTKPTMVDSLR